MEPVIFSIFIVILGGLFAWEHVRRTSLEGERDSLKSDVANLESRLRAVKEDYANTVVELETTKRNLEQIKVSKEVPVPAIIRAKTAAEVRKAFELQNKGEDNGI